MEVKMLDLSEQYTDIKLEVMNKLDRVMKSSKFILGEEVSSLESNLALESNCKYGIGVGNGSDAIHIALQALDIGVGDEVITTPFTFFATAGAISRAGAIPVFVDIDYETYNINPLEVEKVITERTKAILPVHLYGHMSDMNEIMRIAKKHNLSVIEDAAQAIGAAAEGSKVGELSDAATYSFFPTKNLGAYGDAGMIVTNNETVNNQSKIIRVHGSQPKYYHHVLGYNSRLDELQAAILNVKQSYLDQYTVNRRDIADYYNKELMKKVPDFVTTPVEKTNFHHVYHQYTLRVKKRDELKHYLENQGVSSMIYYPVPLHMQPVFSNLGYKKGDFPETEKATEEVLSLPIWPEMKKEQQDYVIQKIVDFYSNI